MWSFWAVLMLSIAVSEIYCDDARSVTVCQRKSYKIECQGEQKLKIMKADYGRWKRGVCKGFFDLDWNTNCHTPAALEITQSECEGLSSCMLHSSDSEYGDPCFSIKKYLTVTYRCVRGKPNIVERVRVCEGKRHAIECPNKRRINVLFANYGRLKGNHICGLIAFTTACGASNSLPVVKHDCQEKQHCELEATNRKFGGDPCVFTMKYLEVKYQCVK